MRELTCDEIADVNGGLFDFFGYSGASDSGYGGSAFAYGAGISAIGGLATGLGVVGMAAGAGAFSFGWWIGQGINAWMDQP